MSNPHMLPKVRSKLLTQSAANMPCTARISSFIPGYKCSGQDTVVFCHAGNLGKGVRTKVSDICGFAGCHNCHALYDARDKRVFDIIERYPVAFSERILLAVFETQARWIDMGLLTAKGMEIV